MIVGVFAFLKIRHFPQHLTKHLTDYAVKSLNICMPLYNKMSDKSIIDFFRHVAAI